MCPFADCHHHTHHLSNYGDEPSVLLFLLHTSPPSVSLTAQKRRSAIALRLTSLLNRSFVTVKRHPAQSVKVVISAVVVHPERTIPSGSFSSSNSSLFKIGIINCNHLYFSSAVYLRRKCRYSASSPHVSTHQMSGSHTFVVQNDSVHAKVRNGFHFL